MLDSKDDDVLVHGSLNICTLQIFKLPWLIISIVSDAGNEFQLSGRHAERHLAPTV